MKNAGEYLTNELWVKTHHRHLVWLQGRGRSQGVATRKRQRESSPPINAAKTKKKAKGSGEFVMTQIFGKVWQLNLFSRRE